MTAAGAAAGAAEAVPGGGAAGAEAAEAQERQLLGWLAKLGLRPKTHRLRAVRDGTASPQTTSLLVGRGLARYRGGAAELTAPGRGFLMAADLRLQFFEACVLAVVHHLTAAVNPVPVPTVERFFEDWPVYDGRTSNAVTRLRQQRLLPGAVPRTIYCNREHLAFIRAQLEELYGWLDSTAEEMRLVVIRYRRRG